MGGLLPGVTVTAQHAATGLARSAVTSEDGDYEIARLPAGDYEVSVFLPGFRADPTAARVEGAETVVDFTLTIAPLAETVTVTRSEQGWTTWPTRWQCWVPRRSASPSGRRRSTRRCAACRA